MSLGLFEKLKIRDVTLRNRIGMSPMCQYSSDNGHATDWHRVHLGSRAVGGAGLVMVEATAVEPRGRISPYDMGLWLDSQAEAFAPITTYLKKYGAVPGIQLAHAGRKASMAPPWQGRAPLPSEKGGWEIVAPTALAWQLDSPVPTELSPTDIATIQDAFVAAAKRARDVGFDWVELHAAHGYLCHSFLSPLTNHRRDAYGGSRENRVRFTVETARKIRKVWPEAKPMSVRLSCTDWVDGGWTLEDSIHLSILLKAEGIDAIDCSSGGAVSNVTVPTVPGYQVPFAREIRKATGLLTAAVGLITEAKQADEIVQSESADIVLLGRELLKNPYWPAMAAITLGKPEGVKLPVQYSHWF